jgi:hypothetical protein
MRPPSECIAPFDEDRQTGLVQTVPAGGGVAVGVGVAVGEVGDAVALAVGGFVAEADALMVLAGGVVVVGVGAAVVAVGDTVAVGVGVAVEAVPEADAVGGFVAEADALMVLGGGVVAPSLSTVKVARRMEVLPRDHLRTAVMVCGPSSSVAVSKGCAEPSLAVPPKSKGANLSVRTGALDCHESSR